MLWIANIPRADDKLAKQSTNFFQFDESFTEKNNYYNKRRVWKELYDLLLRPTTVSSR